MSRQTMFSFPYIGELDVTVQPAAELLQLNISMHI